MLSVHTNYASLVAQNSVNKNNSLLSTAMERLSTGMRINGADDDAAGLQIANRLNANVVGMSTASRNISDGVSMLQTADGALSELSSIANRMKELATQHANGVNSADDKAALKSEFDALTAEATRIKTNTEYAGEKLFTKLNTGVTLQIGASKAETMEVKLDAQPDETALDIANLDTINTFINEIGTNRSALGASINRLGHTASNLANVTENTKAASGRIMDADFANESAAMTKNQLLVQAGTNVLSRANQNTGLVMGLLG
ncbi:TPA: Lateral flagellin [Shewanella algae]|uniref:flagellin N-terminal helical domain-containing protein n=1 Tax=Shewanella algae TaxID=38313 RepID=UPI001C55EE93|nr:flagellin [Shewanella algae]HDS1210062.1 Lateral flagellin [Shewanella algae]